MRKALSLSTIIIATIGLTYFLISNVDMQGFLFAWVLNFLLMMCVLLFTETLRSPFTSSYYNEWSWEANGSIYKLLGVNIFRKLLVLVGWEKLNKKSNPIEKSPKALIQLHYRTKQSEFGHLIILIIVLGFTVFVMLKFGFVEALWLLFLNILLNLYPIFVQRYNRPRLARAIKLSNYRERR